MVGIRSIVDHRKKVKAVLLKVHAVFWKKPDATSAVSDCMGLAFDRVAKVVFDAAVLTEHLLGNDLPALIWDAAVAGGWWRLASETPQSIFPVKRGHYWVWIDDSKGWEGLFRAETADWLGQLLETSTETVRPVPPDKSNLLPTTESLAPREMVQIGDPEDRLSSFMQEHSGATYADIKYSAKVHTPEFQDWRKGELKPNSVMSKRIEDVLIGASPLKKKPRKPHQD